MIDFSIVAIGRLERKVIQFLDTFSKSIDKKSVLPLLKKVATKGYPLWG